MKVLANDGISQSGIDALRTNGFEVITTKVEQDNLISYINENNVDALLVRSATKVRKDLIDACPNLKLIGRGGVGMDNIDVSYAKDKGLHVINTPAASSQSVAELVFAHLYGMVRFLHQSNREMPLEGDIHFKDLKKNFSAGTELRGKTLGIIGFGRIGQETAKIALGVGMNVIASSKTIGEQTVSLDFFDGQKIDFKIPLIEKKELLQQADFVSLHVPAQKEYVLSKNEFALMKKGSGLINAARGGVIDEVALINAIEEEHLKYAALDVFEKEPKPEIQLLMNPELSLTPHIGAATIEAQSRIGTELASQISSLLK